MRYRGGDEPDFKTATTDELVEFILRKEEKKRVRKHKFDEAKAHDLYNLKMSDRTIGQEFGVSANAILNWRKKNHLPANRRKNPRPPAPASEPGKPPLREHDIKISKEAPTVPLKVSVLNDLPSPLREKVEAELFGQPEPASPEPVSCKLTTNSPGIEDKAGTVNKSIYLPGPTDYDPLIFDAFDDAISLLYDRGGQPQYCWRALLAAAERHIMALRDYIAVSDKAVELAAIAAAEEVLG